MVFMFRTDYSALELDEKAEEKSGCHRLPNGCFRKAGASLLWEQLDNQIKFLLAENQSSACDLGPDSSTPYRP